MTKTLKIEGMGCAMCAKKIKGALEAMPQVESAEVSHETGTAVLNLKTETAYDVLKAAVDALGYTVVGEE